MPAGNNHSLTKPCALEAAGAIARNMRRQWEWPRLIEAYQDLQNAMKFDQGSYKYKAINVYSRKAKNPRILPYASAGRRATKASRSLMVTVALI